MENTNNIAVVENHVVLVVNLNAITTKTGNENSIRDCDEKKIPITNLNRAGDKVTISGVLTGTDSNNLRNKVNRQYLLHIRFFEGQILQEGEYHQ